MAFVVNRTTFEVRRRAHTPDFPPAQWLINPPGLAALETGNVPKRYWKIVAGDLQEQSPVEKAATDIDATLLAVAKQERRVLLRDAVFAYLETRYSGEQRQIFGLLYQQDPSLHAVPSARKAALIAWLNWIESLAQGFRTRNTNITSAANIPAVEAVLVNFAPAFNPTDPGTTLLGLLAL